MLDLPQIALSIGERNEPKWRECILIKNQLSPTELVVEKIAGSHSPLLIVIYFAFCCRAVQCRSASLAVKQLLSQKIHLIYFLNRNSTRNKNVILPKWTHQHESAVIIKGTVSRIKAK